jgi:hypothetical protein
MKKMTGKWKFGKKKGARWVWKKRKVKKMTTERLHVNPNT